mmetsp:Transcript_18044/g.51259  ORF Transcript_18044/g.51259 Transcript_18044/m.51259 type:complete len:449 (+) Transcript_18044:78-1424(+)
MGILQKQQQQQRKPISSVFMIQMIFFILLSVIQIIYFEAFTRTNDIENSTKSKQQYYDDSSHDEQHTTFNITQMTNQMLLEPMPMYSSPLILPKEKIRMKDDPTKDSFGSCLILMDDNHYLIEWLAYHYVRLPLRRIIVAIDPRSQTDPTEILNRYHSRGMMKITVWHEEDYMPPKMIYMHHAVGEMDHENLENLYIERQKQFNVRCMSWMRHEGMRWVAMTDVDEYISVNPYAKGTFRIQEPPSLNQTIYRLIRKNLSKHVMMRKGCISMHRLLMGTHESEPRQVQMMVPPGFNGSDFETLRYRYHSGIKNGKYNKVAKCMIDVGRIPGHWMVPDENDAHRPIKSRCSNAMLRIESIASPFMAYHYAGTWEAWNFRVDFREKRKRENYDILSFNKTKNQDDYIRPWLKLFVNQVGIDLAKELLKGAGQVPPKPNVTYMPGGFGNSTF